MEINKAGMDILIDSEIGSDLITQAKAGRVMKDGKILYYPKNDCLGIPTIGIGTITYPDGKKVSLLDPPISEPEALEYLNFELKDKASQIEKWLSNHQKTLSCNQFSALLCFAYNEGCGPIVNPESALGMAILSGGPLTIRAAFYLYNKGTKKIFGIKYKVILPGLVVRRKREADLFFTIS